MGAKKEPSARRPAQGKEVPTGEPSASARSSAEAEIDSLVDRFASTHRQLIRDVRAWLRKRLPTAHEIVYEYRDSFVISYSPNEHGYEGPLALRASADAVSLYFNGGPALPDPAKLLKGSGKQTRRIPLEGESPLARPEVASLIEAALANSPVPFPATGPGTVIIRPTAAKRRRS